MITYNDIRHTIEVHTYTQMDNVMAHTDTSTILYICICYIYHRNTFSRFFIKLLLLFIGVDISILKIVKLIVIDCRGRKQAWFLARSFH